MTTHDSGDAAPARYPDLGGKVALVTGGSRGIGAATARGLASNGARVALVARGRDALTETAEAIRAGGGVVVAIAADCRESQSLERAGREVVDALGVPDIVAAFAGGQGEPVPTAGETEVHWRDVLDANLTATFLTVRTFLPAMTERGSGVIVTMSSSAARQASRANAAYAAAKAGIVAFTRQLAGETAGDGIRVNCLAPGSTENERMRAAMDDTARARLAASFPLGRFGQPVDVAGAALFLASDASSWITGVTLDVAGGQIMP